MSQPAICIPSRAGLDEVTEHFQRHRFAEFPVVDWDGRATGTVGIDHVRRLTPPPRGSSPPRFSSSPR